MTLLERHELIDGMHAQCEIALVAALSDLLRTPLAGTGEERKTLRIKQRWAIKALADLERSVTRVSTLVVSKASEAALADDFTDAEMETMVETAIDAAAGVEFFLPTEGLPA